MTQNRKKQKAKPKNSSKKQSERFIETAREVEADESGKTFEAVFRKIAPNRDKQQ